MPTPKSPLEYVYVPLDVELYADLVRRSGEADVSSYIHHSVESFLGRTEDDGDIWSADYIESLDGPDKALREKYGDPRQGLRWDELLLANGTQVRMSYGGQPSYGEVRHGALFLGEEKMRSPSQFARRVANNTARNAWRDLYLKFPGEEAWRLADGLRSGRAFRLSDF